MFESNLTNTMSASLVRLTRADFLPGGARCLMLALVFAAVAALVACATEQGSTASAVAETGLASYYGSEFHGRRTASGEVYDENKLTAAHRTLPFGTRVRVTNLANGKSVVVRINDRGPFREGRIIDVSRRAARELDSIRAGVVRVRVVRLLD